MLLGQTPQLSLKVVDSKSLSQPIFCENERDMDSVWSWTFADAEVTSLESEFLHGILLVKLSLYYESHPFTFLTDPLGKEAWFQKVSDHIVCKDFNNAVILFKTPLHCLNDTNRSPKTGYER